MTGLVTMSRNWQDHDIFDGDEFSRRDAWAWLISQAAWKPTTTRIKGSKVELGRGELTFSVRFLADKWGWSKSRVDRFISLLRDEGMIETRSKIGTSAGHAAGQGQSILTICNYAKYQLSPKAQRDSDDAPSGTTAGQQRDKEEEGNKKPTVSTRKRATETTLPDDWEPKPFGAGTEAAKIAATWPDEEYRRQVESFTAHHRGHQTKWADWQLAWGNWVRNAPRFFADRRPAGPLPDNRLPGEPMPMWKHQRMERERAAAAGGMG